MAAAQRIAVTQPRAIEIQPMIGARHARFGLAPQAQRRETVGTHVFASDQVPIRCAVDEHRHPEKPAGE